MVKNIAVSGLGVLQTLLTSAPTSFRLQREPLKAFQRPLLLIGFHCCQKQISRVWSPSSRSGRLRHGSGGSKH